jgi:hypothetical protein
MDIKGLLLQRPDQFSRLVGGNAAGDTDRDLHALILALLASPRQSLTRCSIGNRTMEDAANMRLPHLPFRVLCPQALGY